jgi:hypothetical protein
MGCYIREAGHIYIFPIKFNANDDSSLQHVLCHELGHMIEEYIYYGEKDSDFSTKFRKFYDSYRGDKGVFLGTNFGHLVAQEISIAMQQRHRDEHFAEFTRQYILERKVLEAHLEELNKRSTWIGYRQKYLFDKIESIFWASGNGNIGGIDPSLRPGSIPRQGNPGGIDFRSMPIVTRAINNLRVRPAAAYPQTLRFAQGDKIVHSLEKEWQEIESLVNAGITPSSERLKEYLQASCAKGCVAEDLDKVKECIAAIMRQDEERCSATDRTLRDILVVLESARNEQELREVFIGAI